MNTFYFGTHEKNTIAQIEEVAKHALYSGLCADGHLGYVMPIGGVAAYDNQVSPMGVGVDIACGNKAVKLNLKYSDIKRSEVLDLIEREISFGVGQKNANIPKDLPLLTTDLRWFSYPNAVRVELKELARESLGTTGSGNHYVDLFVDDEDYVWIGVHFGSRGFGYKTCYGFLNLAVNGKWDDKAKEQEVLLDLSTDLGDRYYMAMQLCGDFAYASRDWVCQTIAEKLGVKFLDDVHNHHNFAWKEKHFGKDLIVIRKGSTPAFPGQRGFIGGSMGDDAVIVQGIDSERSREALYSTVHGAGRVMSRTEAGGKYKGFGSKRRKVKDGKISRDMLVKWLREKDVELRGGGLDEAPQAYRRLTDVLEAHKGTIEVMTVLHPKGVVMAGEGEFDPFKD